MFTNPRFGLCKFAYAALCICVGLNVSQTLLGQSNDQRLRRLLDQYGVEPLDPGGGHTEQRIALGQALFFDRELSGNRDTSCATCHHPNLGTGDGLALPVGTAPKNPGALGLDRIKGADREFIPRNAPEIFNRGSSLWKSMFWDSRVAEDANGNFTSPAGGQLLPGLSSSLYIQAMFPVTSRDEMRGRDGDLTFEGDVNELAEVPDNDLPGIWNAIMSRLLAIPEYQDMFLSAYPEKTLQELTFADAANAIGAFEIDAYTFLDSPFDRYVAGDNSALTRREKRGAILFYGRANCASCHTGPLLTDQKHWSLAVPQLGPGKGEFAPYDLGRYLENKKPEDLFAFRTPPLRNVAKTAPYMHNGAYNDLRSVIRQHSSPLFSLLTYRPRRNLEQEELWETVLQDWQTRFWLAITLDRQNLPRHLSNRDINNIEQFLRSLTIPDFENRLQATIPESVPSGLPVER